MPERYYNIQEDADKARSRGAGVLYVPSARGIGKTYTTCDLLYKYSKGEFWWQNPLTPKFLYMRRAKVEITAVCSDEEFFFKKYNANNQTEINVEFKKQEGIGSLYDGKRHIGYVSSISTFDNLRGADLSDVGLIVVDEILPPKKSRDIKGDGKLFLHMLETTFRNIEVETGIKPFVILISNPIRLSSNFLIELNLVRHLAEMQLNGQKRLFVPDRDLYIRIIQDGEYKILEEKKNTLVYKFAKGTGFGEESLATDFDFEKNRILKNVNINEFIPVFTIGSFTFFRHKSKDMGFLSSKPYTCPIKYDYNQLAAFHNMHYWDYKELRMFNLVYYDNQNTRVVFENMIDYKD